MCHTSYKRYRNCECVYIRNNPTCCTSFASEHPESHYRGPFRPKLLTWTRDGLNVAIDSMDVMSADVNDERAPKGLTCPTVTAIPDEEIAVEGCPLCDSPRTLGNVQEKQAEGQIVFANPKGKSLGNPEHDPVDRTIDTGHEPAFGRENGLKRDQVRKRAERLGTTATEGPASKSEGSKDWLAQTQSQPLVIKAAERPSELRGHKRKDSDSSPISGSIHNKPHYMDPWTG